MSTTATTSRHSPEPGDARPAAQPDPDGSATDAAPAPLLEVSGLRVGYRVAGEGLREVVSDLDIAVAPGEFVSVVGESGSGKSTLVQGALGLLPANARIIAGSIAFSGVDVTRWSDKRLARVRGSYVGFIPQDPATSLNPVKRVGVQVLEAVRLNESVAQPLTTQQRVERALESLRQAGLAEPERVYAQYPHELSGGMKQRALIAVALAGRPRLIVADEPTSALDVTVQRVILDHIESLRRELGIGVLLITHDLGIALDRSDRIVVMREGRVVERGDAVGIRERAADAYTQRLLLAAPTRFSTRLRPSVPARAGTPSPAGDRADARRRSTPYPDPAPFPDTGPSQPIAVSQGAAPERETASSADTDPSQPIAVREDVAPTPETAPSPDADPPRPPALEAIGVGRRFAVGHGRARTAFSALDGVDIRVERGRTHAVVGESGAGKSTLARLLTGLDRPDEGEIRVGGVPLDALGREGRRQLRRDLQFVYQNPFTSLDPLFTVSRLVAEPLRAFRTGTAAQIDERVREVLDQVALDERFLHRRPTELSGGQRQRVAIARAIALEPETIVLDEAVSALDVSVQAQILQLLVDLQDRLGLSYLFITHDLGVVRLIGDDVTVMQKGRVVESGTVDAVFDAPREEYTRRLIEAIPSAGATR